MRKITVLSVILAAVVFSAGCGPVLQVTSPANLPEGAVVHLDSGGKAITTIYGFSPNGMRLLCQTSENTSVFDASTGKVIYTVPGVAFQPIRHGKAIICRCDKITLLDFAGEQVKEVFHSGYSSVYSFLPMAALSDDGQMAAVRRWDGCLLWDTTTGRIVRKLPHVVESPCFSPGNKTLASVINLSTICIWDVQTGRKVQTIRHERDNVVNPPRIYRLRFSADGKAIVCFESWSVPPISPYVAKARAGHIQIASGTTVYSTSGRKLLQTTGRPIVSGDRKRLLIPDKSERKFIVYDFSTGQKDSEIPANCNSPLAVAPGGNIVAQVQTTLAQHNKNNRQVLRFWDTTTAKLLQEIPLTGTGWACAAIGGDGKTVAVQDGRRIRIIDVETGKMLLEMRGRGGHKGDTGQVVFSPDGSKSAVRFGSAVTVVHLTPLR